MNSKRWKIEYAAYAVLLLAWAGRADNLGRHPEVAAAIQVLDKWIAATVAEREQPGLSIGILYDQELIWSKGYGFADLARRTPATPETVYRIASISKLFTATAIMQLRDAGRLQLDDPVARHLPWFRISNKHPEGPVVTVRHLITHTSGLPRESLVSYWNEPDKFPTREEMIRMLAGQETILPAETEFKYSNLALALAGEVVAAASGMPYAQYIETHILKPLGMDSTRVAPAPGMPGLATGYGRRVPGRPRDVEPFGDARALTAAAGLASTVNDLAKFIALQFRVGVPVAGGPQILRGATLKEMQRIQWLRPDWRSGQGLGFAIRRIGEQVRAGHGGSFPGHRTQIEFLAAGKIGVIVLTNANDGDPQRYLNQTFTIAAPAIAQATAKKKEAPKPDPSWSKYAGSYAWKHSEVEVMILNGELAMIVPDAENPWESKVILTPVQGQAHTFKMKGGSANGELLRFELDAAGKPVKLIAGAYYRLRKE